MASQGCVDINSEANQSPGVIVHMPLGELVVPVPTVSVTL